MMKKIATLTLLSTLISAPALAAETYLGIHAGQNDMDLPGVKASTAIGVFGGYSFNEYIAGELSYTDFGKADIEGSAVTMSGNAIGLSAVGSWPFNPQFSVFAKLGYASTRIEPSAGNSETKGDVTYGVGGQYNATKNIGIRLGYDNYRVGDTTTKDSALVTLAALFKF